MRDARLHHLHQQQREALRAELKYEGQGRPSSAADAQGRAWGRLVDPSLSVMEAATSGAGEGADAGLGLGSAAGAAGGAAITTAADAAASTSDQQQGSEGTGQHGGSASYEPPMVLQGGGTQGRAIDMGLSDERQAHAGGLLAGEGAAGGLWSSQSEPGRAGVVVDGRQSASGAGAAADLRPGAGAGTRAQRPSQLLLSERSSLALAPKSLMPFSPSGAPPQTSSPRTSGIRGRRPSDLMGYDQPSGFAQAPMLAGAGGGRLSVGGEPSPTGNQGRGAHVVAFPQPGVASTTTRLPALSTPSSPAARGAGPLPRQGAAPLLPSHRSSPTLRPSGQPAALITTPLRPSSHASDSAAGSLKGQTHPPMQRVGSSPNAAFASFVVRADTATEEGSGLSLGTDVGSVAASSAAGHLTEGPVTFGPGSRQGSLHRLSNMQTGAAATHSLLHLHVSDAAPRSVDALHDPSAPGSPIPRAVARRRYTSEPGNQLGQHLEEGRQRGSEVDGGAGSSGGPPGILPPSSPFRTKRASVCDPLSPGLLLRTPANGPVVMSPYGSWQRWVTDADGYFWQEVDNPLASHSPGSEPQRAFAPPIPEFEVQSQVQLQTQAQVLRPVLPSALPSALSPKTRALAAKPAGPYTLPRGRAVSDFGSVLVSPGLADTGEGRRDARLHVLPATKHFVFCAGTFFSKTSSPQKPLVSTKPADTLPNANGRSGLEWPAGMEAPPSSSGALPVSTGIKLLPLSRSTQDPSQLPNKGPGSGVDIEKISSGLAQLQRQSHGLLNALAGQAGRSAPPPKRPAN